MFNTEYNLSCKVDKYWIGGRLDALMYGCEDSGDLMENGKWKMENREAVFNNSSPSQLLTSSPKETAHCSLLTPNYYILDYKTGQLPPKAEQDFQTIVYLLAADKFLQKKGGYNSLKFVYLGLKENKEKEIILTPELKKQYEEKIVETCKKIDAGASSSAFVQNKERCTKCEYAKFCN